MRLSLALSLFSLLAASGCSSLRYYGQTVAGHFALMSQSRPIETLLENPRTSEELRVTLRQVEEIRRFATEELGLPDNGSYHQYVALEREAVVWSLVATETFSLDPQVWCYPIIGCAAYRGYFSHDAARAAAEVLTERGRDVAVNAVPAYSTLGWFADPLPSTVAGWPLFRIAELIFHELAHQRLYIPDDSAFNEGFATAVARHGLERWLSRDEYRAGLEEWHLRREQVKGFNRLVERAAERLDDLYASDLSVAEKRDRKAAEFNRLQEEYSVLKREWGGYTGYDRWFDQSLNNAHIVSVTTYESMVPAFEPLLLQYGDDMKGFFRACERLAAMTPSQRMEELQRMVRKESALDLSIRLDFPQR